MRAPRGDAFQMRLVEIARPPGDVRRMARKVNDMLPGAAAGLQRIARLARQKLLQHSPDRLMIAVERCGIEPPVRLDGPAILAELNDEFSHGKVSLQIVAIDF